MAEVILSDSYVDYFLTGAESIDEAKKLRNELQEKLLGGGFPLRKWSSSSVEVLKDLPPHLLETKDVLELTKEDKSIKALGVVWYPSRDVFSFRSNGSIETGSTKRKLLSEIAKIFDPLGWIAPITITFKMLMQATWVKGLQWDGTLPVDLEETWQAAHEQLNSLHQIQFRRSLCSESKKNRIANIRRRIRKGLCSCSPSQSRKTRWITYHKAPCMQNEGVAPLKSISIPKLELCAGHLAARLMKSCLQAISKTRFKVSSIHAWSDSTITLAWISGEPRPCNTFVSNRVSDIIDVISPRDWKHVPTEFNPADLASRGTSVLSLMESSLWWSGPERLAKPVAFWPHKNVSIMRTNLGEEDSKCQRNASTKSPYKIPKIFKCKTVDQNLGFRKSSTSTYETFKKGTMRSLDSSRISGSLPRNSERRTGRKFRPRNSRHCFKRSNSKIKPLEKPHALRG